MIRIESEIQHCLGQEEATSRMRQLLANLSERFPEQVHQVKIHLSGDQAEVSFAAYGYVVTYRAEIYDDQVLLVGTIPDSAKKFESKISEAILSRVEATLMPAPLSRKSKAA